MLNMELKAQNSPDYCASLCGSAERENFFLGRGFWGGGGNTTTTTTIIITHRLNI